MVAEITPAPSAWQPAEPPLGLLEFQAGHFWQSLLQGLPRDRFHELAARSLAASPAAVMLTDRNGIIEYVNHEFSLLTGYAHDEICGLTPRILRSPETPREAYRELWRTLLRGQHWHGEFQNRKKGGEAYWEFASIWPVIDEDSRVEHFLAVKSDITKRKANMEAEQRVLLDSEKALAALEVLRKSLCVCAWCRKVRDENGHWVKFDANLFQLARTFTNHGICPDCKREQLRAVTGAPQPGALTTRIDFTDGDYASKHWGINE